MAALYYPYRGYAITIQMCELPRGRWTWAYAIDRGDYWLCEDAALESYETVLAEAMRNAEFEVDEMNPELQSLIDDLRFKRIRYAG